MQNAVPVHWQQGGWGKSSTWRAAAQAVFAQRCITAQGSALDGFGLLRRIVMVCPLLHLLLSHHGKTRETLFLVEIFLRSFYGCGGGSRAGHPHPLQEFKTRRVLCLGGSPLCAAAGRSSVRAVTSVPSCPACIRQQVSRHRAKIKLDQPCFCRFYDALGLLKTGRRRHARRRQSTTSRTDMLGILAKPPDAAVGGVGPAPIRRCPAGCAEMPLPTNRTVSPRPHGPMVSSTGVPAVLAGSPSSEYRWCGRFALPYAIVVP